MNTFQHPFWEKVKIGNPWECWPWQGGKFYGGYGQYWFEGKNMKAPRVAFFLFHHRWPKDKALHECDYPPCCNPFHIYDGTQQENVRQTVERGKGSKPLYWKRPR